MPSWGEVIQGHVETDSYARSGRWAAGLRTAVQTFVVGYLAVAAWNSKSYAGGGSSSLLYESPEGLQMQLREEFPLWFLSVHRWAGIVLVPLVFLQKHTVPLMAPSQKGRKPFLERELARRLHVVFGYTSLAAMGYMAYCGFALRKFSLVSGFDWAMILFVAPWALFIGAVPFTVWKDYRTLHAVIGAAVFKACIAVPLARTLGVVLQRWNRNDPATIGRDYYLGIAAAAAVIGAWQVADTIGLLRWLKTHNKRT